MSMTLADLAKTIDATICGGGDDVGALMIEGCGRLEDAKGDEVSFLANRKYVSQLKTTGAGAVIVGEDVEVPEGLVVLVAEDPYYAFRNAVVALHGWREHPDFSFSSEVKGNVSEQAVVDPSATIGEGTVVHPFAVIGAGVEIGENCVVYPHTFIGPGVKIGDDCQLYASVTIYDGCVIGDRVTLHSGCVIGQDGFGYATHAGAHHKIPQTGNVVIEDDVEMGAGCAIDRATMGSTVIGEGTKFSNMIAIGHGTKVGKHNLYVAMVGLAGSVETGDYVVMGGQVGVAGHLKIGNMVQIAATSGVMHDVEDGARIGGAPAIDIKSLFRNHLHVTKLPEMAKRLKQIEKKLKKDE